MRKHLVALALGGALVGSPFMIGCDREVAHDETVKTNSDGSTTHKETTVKEKPDGTIVKEQEKSHTP